MLTLLPCLLSLTPVSLAAGEEDHFRFIAIADTQTDGRHDSINWDLFPALIQSANLHGPDLMVVAGDLVAGVWGNISETQRQWQDFNTAIADFDGTVYMVPGNHDLYGGSGSFAAWRESFPWLPVDDSPEGEEGVSYYIDHGNTRFVFITSNHYPDTYSISAVGLEWLDRVLSEAADKDHRFVITHHPVSFGDSNYGGTESAFWQTLVYHDVQGLFTGHWHRYQPSQLGNGGDTWETIIGTGGGWQGFEPIRPYQQIPGFLLVDIHGDQAVATFYGDEDEDGVFDDPLDQYVMNWGEEEQPRGLRGRWTFEDLEDSSSEELGGELEGSLEGGAMLVKDGASGGALSVELSGSYFTAGSIGDYVLSLNGDLTLSLWMKTLEADWNSGWGSALLTYATSDYYTQDEETNYNYWLSLRSDGTLAGFWEYGLGNNVFVASTESADLLDGRWHHVVMVRDSLISELRFYVDGALLGDPVSFDRLPTGGGRGMIWMGANTEGTSGYDYNGSLDEVCIFDLALDEASILQLQKGADCESFSVYPEVKKEPSDSGDSGGTDSHPESGDSSLQGDSSPQGDSEAGTPDADSEPPESAEDDESKLTIESGGCGCGAPLPPLSPGLLPLILMGWGLRRRSAS